MEFIEFVETNGRTVEREAGEHVFRQGDADRHVYVLRDGLLKAYYLSGDGKETIKSFVLPGEMIGSLSSAYLKETCTFNLVCLEASVVIELDFDMLYAASRDDLPMAAAMVKYLLDFAMKKERREREFLTASAEDRYRLLLDQSPELLAAVRQKDIARYLGITPVALSRIRGRHRESGSGPTPGSRRS